VITTNFGTELRPPIGVGCGAAHSIEEATPRPLPMITSDYG
jgi:hypothetical protein